MTTAARRARALPPWFALAAAAAALTAPALRAAVYQGVSDFKWHAGAARAWAEGGPLPTPHFLFQALVIALSPLLPALDWTGRAVAIAVACKAAQAVVTAALLEGAVPLARRPARFAVASGLALALLVATPVTWPSWAARNLYHGYVGTAVYHNPTMLLLAPLAIALWWAAARALEGTPVSVAALALLTIAGALAKPSHLIALLPAAAVLTLAFLRSGRPPAWKTLLAALALPAVLALGWQFAFHFGGGGGLAWAPLQAMRYRDASLLGRFLLSVLFPLAALAAFPRMLRSRALALALAAFGFGTAYAYLLVESDFVSARNFSWSAQSALLVLFVAVTRALLEVARAEAPGDRARLALCAAALAAHVACGVYFLAHPTWW
ncbi:MAG: hypothetical protein ABW221_03030 [Vicinamibacteria bacterium]